VFTARYVLNSTFCPHSVYMCFVWIWEQTAIISLYSINWLVGFYNWDGVSLLRGTFYILRSAHTLYLCFVWIWEQTAIISPYSIDWLVFIPETEYVYCAVRSTFCPHSVFMCFVWIWQQTAIISLYSIKCLVFITETECVCCALRSTFYVLPTQCIYVFCVDLRTNSDYFTVQH